VLTPFVGIHAEHDGRRTSPLGDDERLLARTDALLPPGGRNISGNSSDRVGVLGLLRRIVPQLRSAFPGARGDRLDWVRRRLPRQGSGTE
jgi:hypothetical protein